MIISLFSVVENYKEMYYRAKSIISLAKRKELIITGVIGASGYTFYKTYLDNSNTLSPEKFIPITVSKITPINHNTSVFRLKLQKPLKKPLPIASCVHVKDDSTQIMRPYTPISPINELSLIDLLVKRYDNGHMSRLIHNLKVGDKIDVRGPMVTLPYTMNMKKHIGMICGGTGITPMYQLIDCILQNPEDKTKIYLIYANISKEDILLYNELNELSKSHSEQLKIYYTLDNAPKNGDWTQGIGYVNEEMVKENIPAPNDDVLVLVCGPSGMMREVSGRKARGSQGPVSGILKKLGYTQDQVFKF